MISSNNGNAVPSGGKIGEGKKGGDVTFLSAGDVDFMDPGQSYYTFGNRTNVSFYQLEPDYFNPGKTFASFGRYALNQAKPQDDR